MRRYLIVANRTLGGQQLAEYLQSAASRSAAVRFIVPIHPDEEEDIAAVRLAEQLERLRELGIEGTGELTTKAPMEAALAAADQVDEIVVCTLPPGISRWLEHDLPAQLRAHADLPVTHIVTPVGMPDRIKAKAVRLSVYCGENDQHRGRPLHSEIVRRAREHGLAGATVLRGVEGFGASSVIHTSRLLTLSEDLPMVVQIIDTPERVERFLPELNGLVSEGLLVRENLDVIKYAGRT